MQSSKSTDSQAPDADGDAITHTFIWELIAGPENGSAIGTIVAGNPLSNTETAVGDIWEVTVTPTTTFGNGPAATANVEVLDNLPPVIVAAQIAIVAEATVVFDLIHRTALELSFVTYVWILIESPELPTGKRQSEN